MYSMYNLASAKTALQRNSKRVGECLVWQGHAPNGRYGTWKMYVAGTKTTKYVHRLAYEINKGPIPKGLTIDHLCFNKLCIDPNHLEAVTAEENNQRAYERFIKDNPNYPCGHPRSGPTSVFTNGKFKSGTPKLQRRCAVCWTSYQKAYREKRHASANRLH